MLLVAYALLAITYIAFQPRKYPGHALLKAAPILLLATAVFLGGTLSELPRWFLFTALLFSAAGDIFLAHDTDGETFFVLGLGSFLVSHIFYVLTFLQTAAFHPIAILPILIILILAVGLTTQIWDKLGSLKMPVLAYILVSGVMGVSAAVYDPLNWVLIAGAILFILSDSLIAVQKFWRPIPYRDFLVMSTYYLAQIMIFWGVT
ncbi:MAG: lysoplasmalogenase [Anaerolineae bacterium]